MQKYHGIGILRIQNKIVSCHGCSFGSVNTTEKPTEEGVYVKHKGRMIWFCCQQEYDIFLTRYEVRFPSSIKS